MSRASGVASKTGPEREIELLEEMRRQINDTISELPRATHTDPAELFRLRSQGTKLLNAVEKAILRREISLRLEELEKRGPMLRSFNERYEALTGLRKAFDTSVSSEPRSLSTGPLTPSAKVSSEDFMSELRRVREQIFRALNELNESGEAK